MSDVTPTPEADGNPLGFDPRALLRAVWRRRWLVLLVFVVVSAGTALWATRQVKVYAASTSIIIDPREPRFLDTQIQDVNVDTSSNFWANREYLETQVRVIQSRAVSQRVVEKLGLDTDPDFLGLKGLPEERRAELMQKLDAVPLLQGRIKVEPVKDSRVYFIRVEDGDPTRAALLANEVAQAYIDESLGQKLRLTENATRWLDERKGSLAESARRSELALYDFRRQSDMLGTSIDDRANMVSQKLTATSAALNEAQIRIAGLKARASAVRKVQSTASADDRLWAEALPAARESATLSTLKTRVLAVKNECADLGSRYLDAHPKLLECRERLLDAEGSLSRELSNLVLSIEAELQEAVEKEKNLQALLAAAKQDAFDVEKKKLELDRLRAENDNTRRQYDSVFKRLKDIELSGLLRTSNVRVLDAARPSLAPVRPNTMQSLLLGVLAGLLLGVGLAVGLELLDSSVTSQQHVEETMGVAFLGFLPAMGEGEQADRDLSMHRQPKSMAAECTRSIRTNLLFMSPDQQAKRLLVTSSGPREGKSTVAISLGIAMAQSGNRVILLDTDMRRPRIHKAFGVPNDVGVSSLVVGEGKLEDAVKSTEVNGLYMLACGPIPPNPAELLHTRAFADLLTELGKRYDRIILDSPPVGAVSDALVLGTQVDGVVLVVQAGKTHKEAARRTVRALRDVKAQLYGAVLNAVNVERSRYGEYGYSYRYYGYAEGKTKEV